MKTVFLIIIIYLCRLYLVADDSHIWKHEESSTQDMKRQIPYADENSDLLELPLPVPIPIHKTQKSEKKISESEDEKIAEDESKKEEVKYTEDDTFGVPVPAVGTSPNSGLMYGVLLAVVTETDGYIDHILAPMASYNDLTGYNVDVNYFGFPSTDISYQLYFSHSSENYWEYSYIYKHKHFLRDDMTFFAKGKFAHESANKFYGIGANSDEDDETCYTERNIEFELNLIWEVWEHFFLSASWKGRANWIRKGIIDDTPTIKEKFADVEGINGGYAMPFSCGIIYDSRDDDVSPSEGIFSQAYIEGAHESLLSSFSYAKLGVDGRAYVPIDEDKKFITVVRLLFEYMTGKDIPFYELSMLGGVSTLRGFGDGRFYDNHRFLVNVEERIRLLRFVAAGILVDFEGAVWVEVGQVFGSFDEIRMDDIQTVVGIGFRFVIRTQIVAKVDIGYGDEGEAVFAGIDYPF